MSGNFKKYLIAGLLVWMPLAITIWVLNWLLSVFNGVFVWVVNTLGAVFPGLVDLGQSLRDVPGLGVILVVLGLLLSGVLAANLFGQWVLRQSDKLFQKIPVVRTIYTSVKQVSDTLFSSTGNAFSKALLVQYPRQGSWTIGFLTGSVGGEILPQLQAHSGVANADWISVYVPTTPNPTSGFFLMMPRSEVQELDMSVDAALKYVISMGVVAPIGAHELPQAASRV
jgi:uncharacterized membrane protein